MTREGAITQLKEIVDVDNIGSKSPYYDKWRSSDCGHEYADQILIDLLISLGYQDVVDEYKKITRWFE